MITLTKRNGGISLKKVFALLLASLLLLSACSSESKTSEEATDTEKETNELTVWTWIRTST